MDKEAIITDFLSDIALELPDVYSAMDNCLDEFDGFSPSKMFDQFCEESNKAMRNKDKSTLLSHLNYMSQKLTQANEVEFELIDVYYVESLMWNVNSAESKWAWSYFPENIKELYIKMWGNPSF